MEEKKLVASCSFGKDSLAAIAVSEERGHHISEAVYCRIMFDADTSAELPEHEEFIHCKAIPLLESRYGIKTTIVQAEKTYCEYFYAHYESGGKVGRIYGFPFLRGPWCNTRLKTRPINAWQKSAGEYTAVVGIAADEKARADRKTVNGKFLPLVQYGITESAAFEICKRGGFCPRHTMEAAPAWGAGFATIKGLQSCGGSEKSTRRYGKSSLRLTRTARLHSSRVKAF